MFSPVYQTHQSCIFFWHLKLIGIYNIRHSCLYPGPLLNQASLRKFVSKLKMVNASFYLSLILTVPRGLTSVVCKSERLDGIVQM